MTAITTRIKKLRVIREHSQEYMAEKLHLSLKAYQKLENGQTKMDLARLEEIAKILETTAVELLNADEGIYIHLISQNEVGFNNKQVVINKNNGEKEALLQLIATKDQIIADKDKEIAYLRDLLQKSK